MSSEILSKIISRDESGITELNTRYGPLMRYIISPILEDEQDREECLSEVAMKVWDNIGSFDPEKGSFTAWLTAITRNTALNMARSSAKRSSLTELPADGASGEPSPEETFEKAEQMRALRAAINRLDNKDRIIIYRKYYYLQSTAKIAAELGMSERAVEGRLYRARHKLKELMGGEI